MIMKTRPQIYQNLSFEENLDRLTRLSSLSKTEIAGIFGKPSIGRMIENRLKRKRKENYPIDAVLEAARRLNAPKLEFLMNYISDRDAIFFNLENLGQKQVALFLALNWDNITLEKSMQIKSLLPETE